MAGLGFGGSFQGAFRSLATLAAPAERAGLFAAVYEVSHLAFSLPSVIAGAAVLRAGLHTTAVGFGVAVIALAATALVSTARRTRSTESALRPAPRRGDCVGCPAA